MADYRLQLLNQLEQHMPARPPGRKVVLGARVTSSTPYMVGPRDFQAKDLGARVAGGRVAVPQGAAKPTLEIMTWNTGEASDLRRYGTLTHAERQFVEFMSEMPVDSVEIDLSHSPCTACCDLLNAWLKKINDSGAVVRGPTIRMIGGRKVVVPSVQPRIPASLKWVTLYGEPPQATNWQSLNELHAAGWQLAAPRDGLPSGSGSALVNLL